MRLARFTPLLIVLILALLAGSTTRAPARAEAGICDEKVIGNDRPCSSKSIVSWQLTEPETIQEPAMRTDSAKRPLLPWSVKLTSPTGTCQACHLVPSTEIALLPSGSNVANRASFFCFGSRNSSFPVFSIPHAQRSCR